MFAEVAQLTALCHPRDNYTDLRNFKGTGENRNNIFIVTSEVASFFVAPDDNELAQNMT